MIMFHLMSVFTGRTLRQFLAGMALATVVVLGLASGPALSAAADSEQPKEKPGKPEIPPGLPNVEGLIKNLQGLDAQTAGAVPKGNGEIPGRAA